MDNGGGPQGEASLASLEVSYAAALQGTLQGTVKVDSRPIFLKEYDLFGNRKPTKQEWLSNVEIYKSLSSKISAENILGIQRVGSLWRLYIERATNRVSLISSGITLRAINIALYDKNPYVPDRSDQLRVRVKNIPLSADDSIIVKTLQDYGCVLLEPPSREKLRVDGKLTNCETGDRIVFVKPLKEPLPKLMRIGLFRASVFHVGQGSKAQTCGKCLQEGHRTDECVNDWVCKQCKTTGHKSDACPIDIQMPVDRDQRSENQPTVSNMTEIIAEQMPEDKTETGQREITKKESRRKKKGKKQKARKNGSKPIESYFKSASKDGDKLQKNKSSVCRSPPTPIDELKTQKKSKLDDSSDISSSDDEDYNDSSGSDTQRSQGTLT